jgi:cell division septation protein DedD
MQDQTGWKNHSFTLMVFAGIVFLCSIFFVLGMLVGRAQAQKSATAAAEEAETAGLTAEPVEADAPELTFYETVDEDAEPPALDPAPPKPQPVRAENSRPANAERGPVINLQIAAMRRSADAQKLLADVKRKGFKGFILAPAAGDRNPLYRVQVGPFSDPIQAESELQKLASAGYKAIKR